MAVKSPENSEDIANREMVFTRDYNAPRALVWEAWTNPEHLAHWWGPNGFRTTTHEMNVKTGGVWRYVMHGPDGRDYDNRIVYDLVVPLERLEYAHGDGHGADGGALFQSTVTFEDLGKAQTRVTMRGVFPSAEALGFAIKEFGAKEGGKQTMARLEGYLLSMPELPEAVRELVFTRTFDAPRELVWKAWTEAKHVAQWWGPHGFTNPVCEWDAKPGNKLLIEMRGPGGFSHQMPGEFKEVAPPERLTFVCGVPGPDGELLLEITNTVTFTESGGKTTMTLTAHVLHSQAAAAPMLAGMQAGWSQSLERLAEVVQNIASGAGTPA